ncbi:furin-like protease 2, partial [Leptotrombidium deliense]
FIKSISCKVFATGIKRYKYYLNRGCSSVDYQCEIFTNTFAVYVNGTINALTIDYGFINLGAISGLYGHYELLHPNVKSFSRHKNPFVEQLLSKDKRVFWFHQQKVNFNDVRFIKDTRHEKFKEHIERRRKSKQKNKMFNDPLFLDQWYITGESANGYHMNVIDVWKQGYTGKGIVVTILDDGIQADHPDIKRSYDKKASSDLLHGNMNHALPHRVPFRHGTHCAGEVSSEKNNYICGVGIAFDAKVGGITLLDTLLTDTREAKALSFNNQYIHIYSASWGPSDNGKALGGPGLLAQKAFFNGVTKGRNGLGVLYVWAAGNGGKNKDNCNADGYANSIYTITVSSADKYGLKPWYVEECSSIITSTYSSGANGSGIVTTELMLSPDNTFVSQNLCTKSAGGTSASAPIAAAILALVLQANPLLTWRDMQHIIVRTSRVEPLTAESGWITNAAGFSYSHKFGFGLMDSLSMVNLAKSWTSVPSMKTCMTKFFQNTRHIDSTANSGSEIIINSQNCKYHINYLEKIEAVLTIYFKPRGNLRILLTSESGTIANLITPRPKDTIASKFFRWRFTALCFWGESLSERWNLTIINSGIHNSYKGGKLSEYQLLFHGF